MTTDDHRQRWEWGAQLRLYLDQADDRWVTVPADADHPTSRYRHIVRQGYPTSACGTTALPADTWQPNTRKPRCPTCLARTAETPKETR